MTTTELENKLKISEKTCIHCPTLELAKQVLNIFHQLNLKWCSGNNYIRDTNWDRNKENTVYHPFDGEFSSLEFAREIGCKVINAKEFIALHTEKEEFDLENYIPKGDLEGFPKEIISRMLDCQEEQGNLRDVSIFESSKSTDLEPGGFDWYRTKEKGSFWYKVINNKNFDFFFEMYPKKDNSQELETAKYVQVGDNAILSDYTSTQSSVEIEINTTEEDSQDFRMGDEVINIITGRRGKISQISTNVIYVNFNEKGYTLDGRCYIDDKYPRLLHYRDDYDYDVIDFNNLPKRQLPKRWRAENKGTYYCVDFMAEGGFFSGATSDSNSPFDNANYNSGNYFSTEVEAEIIAQKLNEYFKQLIQEEHE